jgi:hypothetical protein
MVLLEVGVGVDGVAGAGMLHDADLNLPVFSELNRLFDR